MKRSTLIQIGFVLIFSISLGCSLFLRHQSQQQLEEVGQEISVDVVPSQLEAGASMLLQQAIGATRNMLSN